jgi:hypothetical protein
MKTELEQLEELLYAIGDQQRRINYTNKLIRSAVGDLPGLGLVHKLDIQKRALKRLKMRYNSKVRSLDLFVI